MVMGFVDKLAQELEEVMVLGLECQLALVLDEELVKELVKMLE